MFGRVYSIHLLTDRSRLKPRVNVFLSIEIHVCIIIDINRVKLVETNAAAYMCVCV